MKETPTFGKNVETKLDKLVDLSVFELPCPRLFIHERIAYTPVKPGESRLDVER